MSKGNTQQACTQKKHYAHKYEHREKDEGNSVMASTEEGTGTAYSKNDTCNKDGPQEMGKLNIELHTGAANITKKDLHIHGHEKGTRRKQAGQRMRSTYGKHKHAMEKEQQSTCTMVR